MHSSINKINILLYHQVGEKPTDETNLDCFCDKNEFYRQMEFLKQSEYSVISLDDALDLVQHSNTIDRDYVVLTFDDGCESFYKITFPILSLFSYTASIYPVSGFLGKNLEINGKIYSHLKILSEKMLQDLSNDGIHIGAHSVNHLRLSQLSKLVAADEIKNSKEHLEQLIGKHINSFAFPHGSYNNQTIKLLKDHGFSNALTCNVGCIQNADFMFEIPRKYITYFDTLESFKKKLS